MKILMEIILTIAIVINFPELNSLPDPSGAGPSEHNFYISGSSNQLPPVVKQAYITVLEKDIEVSLTVSKNRCTPFRCIVLDHHALVPDIDYRRRNNYITQAIFSDYKGYPMKIVVYVKEIQRDRRELLGAKLPPTPKDNFELDDPRLLNPDRSTWFITYGGTDFEVKDDLESGKVRDIYLKHGVNERPDKNNERGIRTSHVHFAGLHFLVFRSSDNVVVGAGLDPLWMFRRGGPYARPTPHRQH